MEPVFTFADGHVRRYGVLLRIEDARPTLAGFEADAGNDRDWFRHRARELADELADAIRQYDEFYEEIAA